MVNRTSTTTMPVPPASLLHALSSAFAYPSAGIAATTEALKGLDAHARMGFEELVDAALAASRQFPDDIAEKLAYTRLFIGSLRMEAPPYASFYLEKEHTLNGQAAVDVEDIYRQFGIELDKNEKAPADHLRYLLAFMALLAGRFEETGNLAFAEAYTDFRDDYVLNWIDDCADLVKRNAEEPYYPALMTLIVAVLKDDGEAAGLPEGE